ncbi:MAG: AAA family ATPase [Sandaracinaceae bacterium]|nr:AAA family ATPase [Sandaracinaceae bacterium]
MPRSDANRIALRTVRSILDAAHPLEVDVGGKTVSVQVERGLAGAWPENLIALDEASDGPWPRPVELRCAWEGGSVALRMEARRANTVRHSGTVGVRVGIAGRQRELLWISAWAPLADAPDGAEIALEGWCTLVSRKDLSDQARDRLTAELKRLVAESGMPLLSAAKVEIARIAVPAAAVLPDAATAFKRLVRLALYKLDFFDRGPKAASRGAPLVEIAGLIGATPPPSDDDEEDLDVEEESPAERLPLNLIFYGPPGTGKTHHMQSVLIPRFTVTAPATPTSEQVADTELIESLTWFQLVAAALHALGGEAGAQDLCNHPLIQRKYALKAGRTPATARVWGTLQGHTVQESKTVNYTKRFGELVFDKREDGTWFFPNGVPEDIAALREQLLPSRPTTSAEQRFTFVTFHQSYSYEDFIEGIRPRLEEGHDVEGSALAYELEDGVFARAVAAALRLTGFEGSIDDFCRLDRTERRTRLEDAPAYAVFIDEINRGNVSRIFGELISLIEPTKRLGAEDELIVSLPYSRRRFGVPCNLHVIGTMNTADRSVEALDTALRRRFAFHESPPRPELLTVTVEGKIDPARMLASINRRLLKLYDRDHLIGHAYLMPLLQEPSLEHLKSIFRDSILPLLQEYFYGDWGRIGLVLGRDFVRRHDLSDIVLADFPHDDAEVLRERVTYELVDIATLTSRSFRRIYEDVSDDD